jgi:hypothetical protein
MRLCRKQIIAVTSKRREDGCNHSIPPSFLNLTMKIARKYGIITLGQSSMAADAVSFSSMPRGIMRA